MANQKGKAVKSQKAVMSRYWRQFEAPQSLYLFETKMPEYKFVPVDFVSWRKEILEKAKRIAESEWDYHNPNPDLARHPVIRSLMTLLDTIADGEKRVHELNNQQAGIFSREVMKIEQEVKRQMKRLLKTEDFMVSLPQEDAEWLIGEAAWLGHREEVETNLYYAGIGRDFRTECGEDTRDTEQAFLEAAVFSGEYSIYDYRYYGVKEDADSDEFDPESDPGIDWFHRTELSNARDEVMNPLKEAIKEATRQYKSREINALTLMSRLEGIKKEAAKAYGREKTRMAGRLYEVVVEPDGSKTKGKKIPVGLNFTRYAKISNACVWVALRAQGIEYEAPYWINVKPRVYSARDGFSPAMVELLNQQGVEAAREFNEGASKRAREQANKANIRLQAFFHEKFPQKDLVQYSFYTKDGEVERSYYYDLVIFATARYEDHRADEEDALHGAIGAGNYLNSVVFEGEKCPFCDGGLLPGEEDTCPICQGMGQGDPQVLRERYERALHYSLNALEADWTDLSKSVPKRTPRADLTAVKSGVVKRAPWQVSLEDEMDDRAAERKAGHRWRAGLHGYSAEGRIHYVLEGGPEVTVVNRANRGRFQR